MFTPGECVRCQGNPGEKGAIIHDYLPQLGSTLPGSLQCFFRVIFFPHICKYHFKSLFLSSNLLAFSLSYSLFSEKIETIWWNDLNFLPTNLQTNLLLYPLSLLPSCYYSVKVFLLISKAILSSTCILPPTWLLRKLPLSVLSQSSIFNFFFSSSSPMSCYTHLSSTSSLLIYCAIPPISTPWHSPALFSCPPLALFLIKSPVPPLVISCRSFFVLILLDLPIVWLS